MAKKRRIERRYGDYNKVYYRIETPRNESGMTEAMEKSTRRYIRNFTGGDGVEKARHINARLCDHMTLSPYALWVAFASDGL